MFHRKEALLAAIAGVLATCGFAMADNLESPKLSLSPTVTADDATPPEGLLMTEVDKVGAGAPFHQAGLSVSGFVEAGYTYNHRQHGNEPPILPGPFNHEVGNHFMMNQLDLQIARTVATDKFDVGGLVEIIYGTDAGFTHSSGLPFNGNDPTDDNTPFDAVPDKYRANYQFDLLQAYLTINVPVGTGLKITAGKFVSLLGAETINPTGNLFYSHSWAFNAVNYTNTGVLGTYKINDMVTMTAGFSRGWDMTLEDNHACALDAIGSFAIPPMKNGTASINWSTGPENWYDTSHYRTVIDPIVWWQVTDAFKVGFEGIYVYDGGRLGFFDESGNHITHAYGDVWGGVLYGSYMVNEYLTVNGRVEKFHGSDGMISSSNTNVYEGTIGTTITPFPKDPIGMNLMIRPEVRYDWCEDQIFTQSNGTWKDQLTFAADVIFKF